MMQTFLIYCYLITAILFGSTGAFAQAKPSNATKIVPSAEQEAPKSVVPLWTHGSLIFDKKTFESIQAAIKSHDEQIPLEILLPGLFPPAGQEQVKNPGIQIPAEETNIMAIIPIAPKEAPEFYLKSILYFSANNWSLWLNKHKISNNTQDFSNITETGKISIVSVSRKRAVFLWEQSQIDLIFPEWKKDFTLVENDKYNSADKNIIIDSTNGSVSFILRPNQAFISKTLKIIEGAINPSTSPLQPESTLNPPGNTPVSNATKSGDPGNLIKNMETINSVLKQNVEKLR